MIYIKINNEKYPAVINGQMNDRDWDNRETKSITLSLPYAEVKEAFSDGASWSIVMDSEREKYDENGDPVLDENNQVVIEEFEEEFDNSDFHLSGPITDNRDGTCTIKMGKPTDLEDAYEMLIGG